MRSHPPPRLAFLLVYLLIGAWAAAAEREVSPSAFSTGYSVAPHTYPKFAWHGDIGLVVWSEYTTNYKYVAYATRVDSSGALLDPAGIPLHRGPAGETQSGAVVRASEAFVVFVTYGDTLIAHRVTDSGVISASRVVGRSFATEVRAAAAGDTILVVTGPDIYLMQGTLDEVVRIDVGVAGARSPEASGGDAFLLFVPDPQSGKTLAMRLSDRGQILQLKENPFVARAYAWTGRDYQTAWQSGGDVFVQRVSVDLERVGEPVAIARGLRDPLVAGVVGDANGASRVLWTHADPRTVVVSSVSPENEVVEQKAIEQGPPPMPLTETSSGYAISTLGGVTLLDHDFQLVHTIDVDIASFASQHNLAAVRDGAIDLVAFSEALPDADLQFGTPSQILVGGRPVAPGDAPLVASNGETALVTWLAPGIPYPSLMALPLDGEGRPLTSTPSLVAEVHAHWLSRWEPLGMDLGNPVVALAWTGQMYLAVWKRAEGGLRYARILSNGTVLDPHGMSVPGVSLPVYKPVLARTADATLLVWSYGDQTPCGGITCSRLGSKILATRFSADGQPLNASPITIAEGELATRPDVASVGSTGLIVWQERERGIRAVRITASGFVLDAQPLVIESLAASQPTVTRHHDRFLIAWQSQPEHLGDHPYEIRARAVSVFGGLGDPFLVARDTWQVEGPYAWTARSGHAAIGYIRTNGETGMSQRLFYRTIVDERTRRHRALRP